jgi:AcrR family transcriptional regulator
MFNFVPRTKPKAMTDKKEHIINSAVDLFANKGFEGTSIRDIAAAADVNIAMINYYFGTKEKLFEELVKAKAASTRGALEDVEKNTSLSFLEKIDRIIEMYVDKIFSGRKFHRVIHQEIMLGHREPLNQIIVNILFPNSHTVREIIEAGIKKGEFRKVDPELTVASLMGTINQVVQSKKFCNMFMGKEDDYIPYDDPKFRKRVIDHLKHIMRAHLIK